LASLNLAAPRCAYHIIKNSKWQIGLQFTAFRTAGEYMGLSGETRAGNLYK